MKRSFWLKFYEALCALTGILGMFIIANKEPVTGFTVSIISALLFVGYNIATKQFFLLLMSIVSLLVSVYGLVQWMQNS